MRTVGGAVLVLARISKAVKPAGTSVSASNDTTCAAGGGCARTAATKRASAFASPSATTWTPSPALQTQPAIPCSRATR